MLNRRRKRAAPPGSGGAACACSGRLTAVVDGNVTGWELHGAVVRCGNRSGPWGVRRVLESATKEVDGVALKAKADVGVDGSGDADVNVGRGKTTSGRYPCNRGVFGTDGTRVPAGPRR